MTLHIELVGYRKDRETFDAIECINDRLKKMGISEKLSLKNIPDDIILPGLSLRTSDLNLLKNLYLEFKLNPNWTFDSDSLFFGEHRYFFFDLAEKIMGKNKSHLVWHYNFGGCYIPIKFKNISISDEEFKSFGSSINLCHELTELADKLKLDLGDYTPDFELLYEQRGFELDHDPLGFEKMLLLCLYNISLASIKYDLIIEFSG